MFAAGNSAAASSVNYIEDMFSTWLYTGNGTTQTITNGIDLAGKGGLVWVKRRDAVFSHNLVDSVRGNGNVLSTDTTDQQLAAGRISIAANGFDLTNNSSSTNFSAGTYASWTFRKQPKFFDVVTYTGDGVAGKTVAHNLGSVPGCIIVKNTTNGSTNWAVYHRSIGATGGLYLNTSTGTVTGAAFWNNTNPTSTQFTLGAFTNTNNPGDTFVAYLFAHNAGGFGLTGTDNVISCGSFTTDTLGFGSVNLGYEPQFILYKNSTAAENWTMSDNMCGMSAGPTTSSNQALNTSTVWLQPNLPAAEVTSLQTYGTKIQSTGFSYYGGGGTTPNSTYIYIAIRRGPMKVPTLGTSVFSPIARTGTGATANVTGVGFPPDLVIPTARTVGWQRGWYDRLRGVNKSIASNDTGAELTTADSITAFGQDGATYGAEVSVNASTYTFANWFMRRAPGFFDEVCYTGTSTVQNVNHNLAAVPELMIVKSRGDVRNWAVYVTSGGPTKFLNLNLTNALQVSSTYWNDTAPTSTVFTLGAVNTNVNFSGETYVNYLFATVAGVSKVGSYTGTGALQTVACGFTSGARFVLVKATSTTGDWYVWDSARGISSSTDPYLLLNSTAAEVTSTNWVDTDTTGFKLTAASGNLANTNGTSYIFLAIS